MQEVAAYHLIDNIPLALFAHADAGYLACFQVDNGCDSDCQGYSPGYIPDRLRFVGRDAGKWRMICCSSAHLVKVLFQITGGKCADTADIEIKFLGAIRQDKLFVAVLNAPAAQSLIESRPEIIAARDDPTNALPCCSHYDSEQAISLVYDLVGIKK